MSDQKDFDLPRLESVPSELVQELHQKLGRNLLRFQLIEHTLLGLLPYMHPDGQARGDDSYTRLKSLLKAQPMGVVKNFLIESLKIETDTGIFAAYVDAVVKSRSNLVHHFLDV